jgi:hypothetical protein
VEQLCSSWMRTCCLVTSYNKRVKDMQSNTIQNMKW